MSGKEVIRDPRKRIFNDRTWPDFTRIPTSDKPVLKFVTLAPRKRALVDGFHVTMERVSHTVPAYGFIVENREGEAIAYTGDTGPTDLFWKTLNGMKVKALIVETSFPNRMEELATISGHLTPALLKKEIGKMSPAPSMILLMHAKSRFQAEVEKDVQSLGDRSIRFLLEGETILV